jgi:hypothetical protein
VRRFVWLLGLLAIAVVGTVWWTARNAIRLEPLDAQRFAQMSETEHGISDWMKKDTFIHHLALKGIAHAYARIGDDHRALELAQSIPDATFQRDILIRILNNRVERRNPFWKKFIRTL